MRAQARWPKVLVLGSLSVILLACGLQFAATEEAQEAPLAPSLTPPIEASAEAQPSMVAPTEVALEPATATASSTAGPPPILTITASGGRLNVRRGPGPEYDTVAAFRDGQSTNATARSADGSWVLINTPNTSKALGWVTIKTKYTAVGGDVAGLPVMMMDPALPAYIRNCTQHEMFISPSGVILLAQSSTPENQLQFFPGEYEVFDQTTETSVANVTVYEGKTVDIKKDSSGKNFSCQ
jgi:hypothetical protein